MSRASVWAVVPVKPFDTAKVRLAPVLDPLERAQLARVMFEDVLSTLTEDGDLLAGVLVVTADAGAAEIARRHDAIVIVEEAPAGMNAAVDRAVEHLERSSPGDGVIVIPADLPHLSVAAIEQIVRAIDDAPSVALVPARDDGGTNLLGCRPAGAIRPHFGWQSCERHQHAARRAGIVPGVLSCDDLGRDIDRPEDLPAFLALGTATRTHSFLSNRQPFSLGMTSRAIVSI